MSWGDDLLKALRVQLVGVAGVPAVRRWANTTGTPDPSVAFVEDGFVTLDSEYRECGPGAWRRTYATYRVNFRYPLGVDLHAVMSVVGAVEVSFSGAALSVGGQPVEILGTRAGPSLSDGQWTLVPFDLSLSLDHP